MEHCEAVAEYDRDFKPAQKKKALDLIKETFGDKVYMEDDLQTLMTAPLKDLTTNGKQICILIHNRIYDDFTFEGAEYSESRIAKEYGFFNSGKWMQSKWQ